MFGNRIDSGVVSLYRDVDWPHVTPTTRLKKFLWGYLKAKCCTPPPVNLDQIRRRISREMDEISRNKVKIRRAVRDMMKRARLCIDRGEENWETLILSFHYQIFPPLSLTRWIKQL